MAALRRGSYQPVDTVPAGVFAYLRADAGERVLVALNFTGKPCRLSLPDLGQGRVVVATHLTRDGAVDLGDMTLDAHEGLVIAL